MTCTNSCIGLNGGHCWHGHTGAWHSITPPPMTCCHCGMSPQQLHGPYAPTVHGTTTTEITWGNR